MIAEVTPGWLMTKDRQLDHRQAGVVGEPGELLQGLELALVAGSDMSKRLASR